MLAIREEASTWKNPGVAGGLFFPLLLVLLRTCPQPFYRNEKRSSGLVKMEIGRRDPYNRVVNQGVEIEMAQVKRKKRE